MIMKKALLLLFLGIVCTVHISAQRFQDSGSGLWFQSADGITALVTFPGNSPPTESNPNTVYVGNIVIPAAVTHGGTTFAVTGIGDRAFFHAINVTSVVVPSTVRTIGSMAFQGCIALTTIDIPEGVESIADSIRGTTKRKIKNTVRKHT